MRRPSGSRVKVVYWNNMPTPYVVGRFNALVERGRCDLEAWFDCRREPDRSWDVDPSGWKFTHRYLENASGGRLSARAIVRMVRTVRPDLLVMLHGSFRNVRVMWGARRTVPRLAIRVLPTYDSWIRRTAIKEAAKHVVFRLIDSAKVSGEDAAAYAARYGLPAERQFRVTQSVDVEHYASAKRVSAEEREALRRSLGLEGFVFGYVGRVWEKKGIDCLIEAFRAVAARRPGLSLLIVGDGRDLERYRAAAADEPRIRFAGFVQPERLPAYYASMDAFVFPTLGDPHGLVVEESMAAGVPVIASDSSGDIRLRIDHGRTGLIFTTNDSVNLGEQMERMLDPAFRASVSAAAAREVASKTHDHWASDFERFVEGTMRLPSRPGWAARLGGGWGRTT